MSKFYVVWRGRTTGIFSTWLECKSQVHKFPGAKFKSFKSLPEARKAFSAEVPSWGKFKTTAPKASDSPRSDHYKYVDPIGRTHEIPIDVTINPKEECPFP